MLDKSELLIKVLDRYGVRYRDSYSGWQSVRCPNEAAHVHGDENPSCRINLTLGMARCLACDVHGDGYSIVMQIEGVDFKTAKEQLGGTYVAENSDWLSL